MKETTAEIGNEREQAHALSGRGGIDLPFLVLVFFLLLLGLVMVFSASHISSYYEYGDSYYYIKSQGKYALLGIAIMFAASFATPKIYKKLALPLLGVSVVLLVLVLFVGVSVNDAKRWLYVAGVSIQPSEVAKLGVILSFALMISAGQERMKTFKKGILPFAVILGIIAFLLVEEPHFSGAILIIAVGAVMMLVGGANLKWFALAGSAGAAALSYVIFFTSYARARIEIWLNPWADPAGDGYQIIQSLYAIGSGGLMGLGLGQSRQKYLYIPEPQNDFIFSIICEELGFIGALIIIVLFVLLIWRGFVIAFRSTDRFCSLAVVGIMSRVAIQTILNIAVVTNAIPVTGISLPFFSSGGTSLVMLLFEMGIVLCFSRYTYRRQ